MDKLTKLNKHETNPFRPDLPESITGISPDLYDFLRELAETLREQHNLTQAGDTTFSWEVLTQVDLKRRYNVGSLGRFYHPTYGVIHARYCRISGMRNTEWLGAPVGIRTDGDPLKWAVTNDFTKSTPDLVVGLGGWYVLPPDDSYGWVIVNGVNIQAVAMRKRTNIAQFDKFVWGANDRIADAAAVEGKVFGSILGVSDGITEINDSDITGDYALVAKADRLGTEEFQRFQPLFWTTNFPSTMIASLTTDGETLICDGIFYKSNDLVGVIWESEDRWDHPWTAYDTNKDYSNCVLEFVMNLSGDTPDIDDVNGPVLTIQSGERTWFVRLNNYKVSGSATSAEIRLDFDDLAGGFEMDDPVDPTNIDRMFIGFVSTSYSTGEVTELAEPEVAQMRLSNIHATGTNATLIAGIGAPINKLRMTNGYDDTYNLCPERLVRNVYKLGYRDWFNHYVGMSHYFYWEWDSGEERFITVNRDQPLNPCARAWHLDLCKRLKTLGFTFIMSISYEMLNNFMPADWRQLDSDGLPALSGWEPPSSLYSPCNPTAMAYLDKVFVEFADILAEAELPIHMQVGEPWWWVDFRTQKPYFYDPDTVAKWETDTGLSTPIITDMKLPSSSEEIAFLNWLGDRLCDSTLQKINAVRAKYPSVVSYVLVYLPQILNDHGPTATPEVARVNMPVGWAKPAWDVLQLEDYDFVIEDRPDLSEAGRLLAEQRLKYSRDEQQYFAGFVLFKEDEQIWASTSNAIRQAWEFGVPEVFVWAYTQVMRDGYVNQLDPDNLFRQWNIPAGYAFVEHQADSERRIKNWIKAQVDAAVDSIATLQAQVNQLAGSGGIGGLTVRITAAEKTLAEQGSLITRQNGLVSRSLASLSDRVSILEQLKNSGSGAGLVTIRTDLNNLTNSYNTYTSFNNSRVDILRTQVDGLLATTSTLPGQFEGINTHLSGLDDRITNLNLWQLADVPDDYSANAGYFLQVLNDGSGVTFSPLTAGIVAFTPTGGLSSTDVQSALNELDTEKARLDGAAFSGTITVPDLAYNASTWDGSAAVPTRNAIRDKIEAMVPALLPTGGASGTILQKYAGIDYATTWSALTAGIVTFTPTGTIASTDVQSAIAEVASEAVPRVVSTDNGIARFDGTNGAVQNSGVIIDDSNNVTGWTSFMKGTGLASTPYFGVGTVGTAWAAGTSNLFEVNESLNSTAAGSRTVFSATSVANGTAGSNLLRGFNFLMDWNSSGTCALLVGVSGVVRSLSGTVTLARGVASRIRNLGGTITTANTYEAIAPTNSGSIGTLTGLYIGSHAIAGVTTAWGVYQQGPDNNAFEGKLRVGGATAPTNSLSVTGSADISGSLTVLDDSYDASTWDGSAQVPTKNAIRDKIEALITSIAAKLTGTALTSSAALIPTLNSPWINYGGGFGGARYYKSADGVVHIEGLIQAPGGSSTSGVVLFTLLAGYRPPDTLMFGPWSGGGSCRIDVQSNGDVVMQSGNTAFTSLSGIKFIPA